jgi:hypothetical protein
MNIRSNETTGNQTEPKNQDWKTTTPQDIAGVIAFRTFVVE